MLVLNYVGPTFIPHLGFLTKLHTFLTLVLVGSCITDTTLSIINLRGAQKVFSLCTPVHLMHPPSTMPKH